MTVLHILCYVFICVVWVCHKLQVKEVVAFLSLKRKEGGGRNLKDVYALIMCRTGLERSFNHCLHCFWLGLWDHETSWRWTARWVRNFVSPLMASKALFGFQSDPEAVSTFQVQDLDVDVRQDTTLLNEVLILSRSVIRTALCPVTQQMASLALSKCCCDVGVQRKTSFHSRPFQSTANRSRISCSLCKLLSPSPAATEGM